MRQGGLVLAWDLFRIHPFLCQLNFFTSVPITRPKIACPGATRLNQSPKSIGQVWARENTKKEESFDGRQPDLPAGRQVLRSYFVFS